MKIFSILSSRNIEIHSETQSGTVFFTRYRSLITSAVVHTMYRITGLHIYIAVNAVYACGLNFSRSPSRCADIICFFPFHLIFNGRAHIRGLCATGGGYYSAALNTRGFVLVRFALGVAATRECSPCSCNIKISFR